MILDHVYICIFIGCSFASLNMRSCHQQNHHNVKLHDPFEPLNQTLILKIHDLRADHDCDSHKLIMMMVLIGAMMQMLLCPVYHSSSH